MPKPTHTYKEKHSKQGRAQVAKRKNIQKYTKKNTSLHRNIYQYVLIDIYIYAYKLPQPRQQRRINHTLIQTQKES